MRDFQPLCRYHNTPLIQAKTDTGTSRWAIVAVGGEMGHAFAGELFVCPKCGYTEFYDDDPTTTEATEKER